MARPRIPINEEKFIALWLKNKRVVYIAKYFEISKSTVSVIAKRLSLGGRKRGRRSKVQRNTAYVICGISFESRNDVEQYILDFLSTYDNATVLSNEHSKFIIECLRLTEDGNATIDDGINKILASYTHGRGYYLYVPSQKIKLHVRKLLGKTKRHSHRQCVRFVMRSAITQNAVKGLQLHHVGKTFSEILHGFLDLKSMSLEDIKLNKDDDGYYILKDKLLENNGKNITINMRR